MYGQCLSAIGGGQALTSPKRHSLGKLLPYQLADTQQADQRVACAFTVAGPSDIKPPFGGLFPSLWYIPVYYYPVRH